MWLECIRTVYIYIYNPIDIGVIWSKNNIKKKTKTKTNTIAEYISLKNAATRFQKYLSSSFPSFWLEISDW